MNELTADLNNSGVSIEIANTIINNLSCADDIVLVYGSVACHITMLFNSLDKWQLADCAHCKKYP